MSLANKYIECRAQRYSINNQRAKYLFRVLGMPVAQHVEIGDPTFLHPIARP
jgi:hypothetical protein